MRRDIIAGLVLEKQTGMVRKALVRYYCLLCSRSPAKRFFSDFEKGENVKCDQHILLNIHRNATRWLRWAYLLADFDHLSQQTVDVG